MDDEIDYTALPARIGLIKKCRWCNGFVPAGAKFCSYCKNTTFIPAKGAVDMGKEGGMPKL